MDAHNLQTGSRSPVAVVPPPSPPPPPDPPPPLGRLYYLAVMLGENGRFYTSFDDLLWDDGDSPSEMIDIVLSLGRAVQIP